MVELHLTDATINQFGRYNDLVSDLDINKAVVYFENKLGTTVTKEKQDLRLMLNYVIILLTGA